MPASVLEPHLAIARMAARLESVSFEPVPSAVAVGRVLAADISLDRDSPACDVSAMDGFAVRQAELSMRPLPVVGECRIGEPPETLPVGAAMRIYTGSPVPSGADTVVRLERVSAADGKISLLNGVNLDPGEDIRRRGENAKQGAVVLAAGCDLSAAAVGALATVGAETVTVYRRLRVAVITTGNELEQTTTGELATWRLRDSNGPALVAMLGGLPWVERLKRRHATDSLESLTSTLAEMIDASDAVVLTGGVSKGAYDFVPDAVRGVGGEVVFHRMRARPGQPTLGAVAGGKLVLGLPGNPLAVLTAGRRVLTPLLCRLAGFTNYDPPAPRVTLEAWTGRPQPLTWWRPVSLTGPGMARLTATTGSGDVCGPAMSDGFVEVTPDSADCGSYSYYAWRP